MIMKHLLVVYIIFCNFGILLQAVDVFESFYPILCEVISHNIVRVASHCVQLISQRTLDITMINTTLAYDRACELVRELHRHLQTSEDQQQYLLNLINIFHEVGDLTLSAVADEMKSKLQN